jgi:hypothetical protein
MTATAFRRNLMANKTFRIYFLLPSVSSSAILPGILCQSDGQLTISDWFIHFYTSLPLHLLLFFSIHLANSCLPFRTGLECQLFQKALKVK